MKLKELRLHGFKSFADRTTIEFRDGVTAIVGSNGCGKSNVADAVRWALGEQRASAVRGARMDDIIFQGTARRRALNFAEVTLLFSNEAGRVALPQSEIEVARKAFREGGSEYALNRAGCRLRDIQTLLRDTGLGANAYSIIEAGMIETLLSDRAEERRQLFEEAAGVGRYKDSRASASRRLEAAEADLARLDDLVAEVETKVRSLARQRRRTQRYDELHARRRDLDVALARREVEALSAELEAGARRLRELVTEEAAVRGARASAEALLETRRAELAQRTTRRAADATALEHVRQRLGARERELLLADERRTHAEMRVAQLSRERQELSSRAGSLAAEHERSSGALARARERIVELRDRLEACRARNDALRAELAATRAASDAAAEQSRDVARHLAGVDAERAAAEQRGREAAERLTRLEAQADEVAGEAERLAASAASRAGQTAAARERLTAARGAADAARGAVHGARAAERAARDALHAAEDAANRLAAQLAAREALERDYEGFAPAVQALLRARQRFGGIRGPLADFVGEIADAHGGHAAAEAFLGPLLQALVVDSLATAREIRRWLRDEWKGGGSLLLLPLDAPALAAGAAPAEGRDWAVRLLADLQAPAEEDPLAAHRRGVALVGQDGEVIDARSVVRLTARGEGDGILTRRRALERLRGERDAAEAERRQRLAAREGASAARAEAEAAIASADDAVRTAEAELRRLESEDAAVADRRARLVREHDDLARTLAALRAGIAEAARHAETLAARRTGLAQAAAEAAHAAEQTGPLLSRLDAEWERARDEDAELRVSLARAEADVREAERRLAGAARGAAATRERDGAIDAEAATLRATIEELRAVRQRAAAELEALFAERDRATAAVARADEHIAALEAEMSTAGQAARDARRREAEAAEERHRRELAHADAGSRFERVRERLEVEWARPWDVLLAEARAIEGGTLEEWAAEARAVAGQIEQLGPVNMLAAAEHAEEESRLGFLHEQRADLVKARDDLVAAIRQIDRTARDVYASTFATIRENFHRVFHSLFEGGSCDLRLADPDDPLESAIEIQASPRGKRTQRIHLLSGGERTLTALALLFALYLVKPSPFCVLDEIDAPLDESNVGRFLRLLHDFKQETQFIVITHNPRTMEAADWIYGVTMEEPGVSTVVGVELAGAWAEEAERVA